MATFITGGTGFLGSYVLDDLLTDPDERVILLTRGADRAEAEAKLWKAMQLHWDAATFRRHLPQVAFALGDVTAPRLGLSDTDHGRVLRDATSVLHIAASLNRKSEKACLNTNMRGTLEVIRLTQAIAERIELRRFSFVSTVAVAGHRNAETVLEDDAIDWARSDYDPYARTKKFCEHMVERLLHDLPRTIFRPSIVMGDSRFPQTTQFDMVMATCTLADLPVIPFRPDARVDIVNADWVGPAIARLHKKARANHEIYHLAAGTGAKTIREITEATIAGSGRSKARYVPALYKPFEWTIRGLNRLPRGNNAQAVGALMKVFLPYVTFDTVFDNARAVSELGVAPVPFTEYAAPLYRFAKDNRYRYPFLPLPRAEEEAA